MFFFDSFQDPGFPVAVISTLLIVYVIVVCRADYLNVFVAFLLPWLLIIGFSFIPMSKYAIPIHKHTYELVLLAIFSAMIGNINQKQVRQRNLKWEQPTPSRMSAKRSLFLIDLGFWALTLLNVAIAGYIPLLRGVATGDTGYVDFGVHGLYGFYLAFANALAIFHLALFLRTGRKVFLFKFFSILAVFILFVTRQNVISTIIEGLVVYSVIRGQIRRRTLAFFLIISLIAFSLVGLFRSGNIKLLSGIQADYMWVPDPAIWLYAYSYFNIANLDNLIHFSQAPFFDGSSFSGLIPSFFRPTFESESYLQMPLFNVSSYLYPIFQDLGVVGSMVITFCAIWITRRKQEDLYENASLSVIGTFATLYFCAAFSFFVNFWFFLPIIFQIAFFKMLSGVNNRAALYYSAEQALNPSLDGGLLTAGKLGLNGASRRQV